MPLPFAGKLDALAAHYDELEHQMAQPDIATNPARLQQLARERASLEGVVSLYARYRETEKHLESARSLLQDEKASEPELLEMARQEAVEMEERCRAMERDLKLALLPRDPRDERDVIVEVRAGAGGTEAALFAADLYRMYTRYALARGWKAELVDASASELEGYKEIIFEVRGEGAYSRLKYESGVHRVQRVPVTESSGRIHTSTATVAVLPEADEVDVHINPDDLRIDIFHAGGHGGQNVQKVATAVRIVHKPTGIVAVCQDERSQLRNKDKAMAVLRARLYQMEMERQQKEITEARRAQVGSGDRSEKIRTYNYPQDRLTDHRIGLSVHGLERILTGQIDNVIDALIAAEQERNLEAALST
jgi:peptide chain release factor 1